MFETSTSSSAPTAATSTNELEYAGFKQVFTVVDGLKLCSYTNLHSCSGLDEDRGKQGEGRTILVLLHGYPQSPYIWRHIAPQLASAGYKLFIPDLPGYANSPDRTHKLPQDKLSIGTAILTSLHQHLSASNPAAQSSPHDIILITHDRGSRVGHRLAVSQPLRRIFRIKALSIMDIIPTAEQFASLGRTEVAKGYFHWAMLANVNIATKLIVGMGGGNWVGDMVGKMTRKQDTKDAVAVYAPHFDDEDVVRASCRDYEAAALVDVPAQVEDQRMGKKVGIPMLVFWSQIGLGRWFDVAGSWGGWIAEDVDVEFVPVGEGAGHYIPEDASEFVGEWLLKWLEKVD